MHVYTFSANLPCIFLLIVRHNFVISLNAQLDLDLNFVVTNKASRKLTVCTQKYLNTRRNLLRACYACYAKHCKVSITFFVVE